MECTELPPYSDAVRYFCGVKLGAGGIEQIIELPLTDEEKAEAKKVARRQLIAFNKASDAAQVVRREYLTKLLTRKTPPKGAAELTARVMIAGGAGSRQVSDHEVKSLAAELLGEVIREAAGEVEDGLRRGFVLL